MSNNDNNINQNKKRGRPPKYSSDEERKRIMNERVKERNKKMYETNEEFRNKVLKHKRETYKYEKKDILDCEDVGRKKMIEITDEEKKDELLHKLKNDIIKIIRLNKKAKNFKEDIMNDVMSIYNKI
jgi:hypothetical protein